MGDEIAKWVCIGGFALLCLFFLYVVVAIVLTRNPGLEKTTVYDKVKYYPEAEIATGHAYVPVGMFLGWLIDAKLVSGFFEDEARSEIRQFRERSLTGPQVYESWDGVLVDDMLSEEGNRFAKEYFRKYWGDFEDTLCGNGMPATFEIEDTWENYERISGVLDERFRSWKQKHS